MEHRSAIRFHSNEHVTKRPAYLRREEADVARNNTSINLSTNEIAGLQGPAEPTYPLNPPPRVTSRPRPLDPPPYELSRLCRSVGRLLFGKQQKKKKSRVVTVPTTDPRVRWSETLPDCGSWTLRCNGCKRGNPLLVLVGQFREKTNYNLVRQTRAANFK